MPIPSSYCPGGCGAAYCSDPELGGGGQTVEAAGSCVGGDGGKGLEAALGAGSALAVCVLRPPTWWTGFDTGWSTTWTGLGARVGGGFSQNVWSGCGPWVTWTVCGW